MIGQNPTKAGRLFQTISNRYAHQDFAALQVEEGHYKLQSFQGYDHRGARLAKWLGISIVIASLVTGSIALAGLLMEEAEVQVTGGVLILVLAALGILAGYWITRFTDVAEYQLEFNENAKTMQLRSYDRKGHLYQSQQLLLSGADLKLTDGKGFEVSQVDLPQSPTCVEFNNKHISHTVLAAERQLLEPIYIELKEIITRI